LADCLAGGLGEAVELASACAWGDEALFRAQATEFAPGEAILPREWLGLTAGQMAARRRWNAGPLGTADWRPEPLSPVRAIDWIAGRDAHDGAKRWAPADLVLIGRREAGDPDAVGVADTRGCAAGATAEAALLHALRELAERDAVGRWWHGGRGAAALPCARAELDTGLVAFLHERPRVMRLLRLAPASEGPELGGVVVAAASWEPDGRRVALGFAARSTEAEAAAEAVMEMLQTELGLAQRAALADPLAALWQARVRAGHGPLAETLPAPPPTGRAPGAAAELGLRLDRLAVAGRSVTLFDLTRPAFGVPVLRAVVPGLACDRPRWQAFGGRPRQSFPLLV
jgi:ribosomal protein S12 methylthiotransferase accessory factor YcaO